MGDIVVILKTVCLPISLVQAFVYGAGHRVSRRSAATVGMMASHVLWVLFLLDHAQVPWPVEVHAGSLVASLGRLKTGSTMI